MNYNMHHYLGKVQRRLRKIGRYMDDHLTEICFGSLFIATVLGGGLVKYDDEMRIKDEYEKSQTEIVRFYQENEPCPSDTIPEALDERIQNWLVSKEPGQELE